MEQIFFLLTERVENSAHSALFQYHFERWNGTTLHNQNQVCHFKASTDLTAHNWQE